MLHRVNYAILGLAPCASISEHPSVLFVSAMTTSFAWPSVLGNAIIKFRTVVKCTWEQTFEGLLQHLGIVDETVKKVEISRNESFTDPIHIVPLGAPVSLYKQFDCLFVCIYTAAPDTTTSESSMPNAFQRLMESSRRLLLSEPIPPPGGSRGLRGDQRLHNDLLGKTEPAVVF